LEDYRRVVELDPEDDEAGRKLAELLLSSHQASEALPYFLQWSRRQPDDPDAILGLARCQAELDRADEAIASLDRLLAVDPKHAAALALHGKLAFNAGQLIEAEKWLRRSLAVAPFERDCLYSLYRCLQSQDRPKDAQQCLEAVERIDADLERSRQLKQAIQKSPHDASLRCEMGRILLRNGQEREGRRWLESALKQDPDHAAAHAALADSYERAGDPLRAAQHRRSAGRLSP
jgi:predicted Zn-dependent protease